MSSQSQFLQIQKQTILWSRIWLFFVSVLFLFYFITGWSLGSSESMNIDFALAAPSVKSLWGFDSLGRNFGPRLFSGFSFSIGISMVATLTATFISIIVAAVGELSNSWIKKAIWFVVDIFNSLPILFFSGVILSVLTLTSLEVSFWHLGVLLGISGWWTMARVISVLIQKELSSGYIEASRALGASSYHLFFKHILPALRRPILVYAAGLIPGFILTESFFSFIGLGIQPPGISLGVLLREGWAAMGQAPHLVFFPAILMFLTLLSMNRVFSGDSRVDFSKWGL